MNKTALLTGIIILALSSRLSATGDETILRGTAKDYAGDTLTFMAYSNMITFSGMELGRCAVDDSGYFEFTVPLEETTLVYTEAGIYNCYLYACPGTVYDIRLPSKREKTLQDMANPYFEPASIHLSVKPSSGDTAMDGELNFDIRAFNDSFYPYYYKYVINALGNKPDRREIEKAADEVRSPFDSIPDNYLQAYIDHRLGLLKHYGSQVNRSKIIDEYFSGRPVLANNPAYMELFNEVFGDFFPSFAKEHPGTNLPMVLNREIDYHEANRILAVESSLKNDTLREMVMLKGLYDGFYDGKNLPESMMQMLDSLDRNSSIEINKRAAKDILLQVSRLMPGYEAPGFTLRGPDSSLVSLSAFRGEYIYLNFCNSFASHCFREFEYIRVLEQRLGDQLKIITILVDDSFMDMQKLVRDNDYRWTFTHFSGQPDVIKNYDIRAYPSYFLISPSGELILSPAPSPSQNFEGVFLKMISGN